MAMIKGTVRFLTASRISFYFPLADCFEFGPAWQADVCAAKTQTNIQKYPPEGNKKFSRSYKKICLL